MVQYLRGDCAIFIQFSMEFLEAERRSVSADVRGINSATWSRGIENKTMCKGGEGGNSWGSKHTGRLRREVLIAETPAPRTLPRHKTCVAFAGIHLFTHRYSSKSALGVSARSNPINFCYGILCVLFHCSRRQKRDWNPFAHRIPARKL